MQDSLLLNDNDNISPNPLAQVKVRLIKNSLFNNKDQMNIDRTVDQLLTAQIKKCNTSSIKAIHTFLFSRIDKTPSQYLRDQTGDYHFTLSTREFNSLGLGVLPEANSGTRK